MGAVLLASSPDVALALCFHQQQEWLRPLWLPRSLGYGPWFRLKLWFWSTGGLAAEHFLLQFFAQSCSPFLALPQAAEEVG